MDKSIIYVCIHLKQLYYNQAFHNLFLSSPSLNRSNDDKLSKIESILSSSKFEKNSNFS